MFSKAVLKEVYKEWLSGSTLRALGAKYGVGFGSVHLWLKKEYGVNACSPKHQSLVRSVLADNPYDPQLLDWAYEVATQPHIEPYHHLSQYSQQMLTKYQTLSNPYLEEIEVEDEPELAPLSGKYVFYFLNTLTFILYQHLVHYPFTTKV